ncbi:hypothetical protein O9H85_09255 [Paenibacillus filicis]|uniref:50S ribosomal protein L33 n=1 Tax=Paenibacillus gyeongsangnamensis TaxID=3388067 RepID=A0ABT4Q6U9_9BACL|nr:hypothetical protein [Paenibacillus filicis]MCZ8512595.1 hypothetical protein [Paenibacillus filicis]
MQKAVRKQDVQKLIGKQIYALKKDGTVVEGKLVKISGNRLIVAPKGKQVKTSAFIPLVLFDLLAIGTSPFAFGGGFGFPFGGGFGGGFGFPFGGGFF